MKDKTKGMSEERIGLIVLGSIIVMGMGIWWITDRLAPGPEADAATFQNPEPFNAARGRPAKPATKYMIIESTDVSFKGCHRISIRVRAEGRPSRQDIMEIARWVAVETVREQRKERKRPAAVGLFFYADDRADWEDATTLAAVDYAPSGRWEEAARAGPRPNYRKYALLYRDIYQPAL